MSGLDAGKALVSGEFNMEMVVAVHGCRDTAWTRKTRMDATGLSRGGSRSPLQTGQTHHCCLSVAWNVTDHGTSPWHLHLEKPFVKCATNVRTPA
ncbi:MAG: hypothetical protein R6U98_20040, partial [Pirellulaceae bacterium]